MPSRVLPSLLAALAVLSSAAPAEARKLRIGVVANTIGYGSGVGARQDEVLHTGARWIREELTSKQDRAQQDRLFRAAALRGMRVLPLVSPDQDVLPADPSAYAAWTAHLTGRYGPGGSFWRENPELDGKLAPSHFEVWNEPYFPFFSGQVDPARYAQVYVAAVQAGRQANPAARFLLAVTTDAKTAQGTWVNWTDAMFAARPDLGAYIDAVAAHPYHRGDPGQGLDGYVHDKFRRIERIRDALARHGVAAQFWLTELGWSTCTATDWCMSEPQQAARLTRALTIAATEYDFVDAVFLYHLRSWGNNPADRELHFGILRPDGTAKPAYVAFAEAVAAHAAPVYENAPQLGLVSPWTLAQVRERALRAAPPNLRRQATAAEPPRQAAKRRAKTRRSCRTVRRKGRRVKVCRAVAVKAGARRAASSRAVARGRGRPAAR